MYAVTALPTGANQSEMTRKDVRGIHLDGAARGGGIGKGQLTWRGVDIEDGSILGIEGEGSEKMDAGKAMTRC